MSNLLQPERVLSLLAQVLNLQQPDASAAASTSQAAGTEVQQPMTLKSGADLIVALIHAEFLGVGFRFLGLGEEGSG
ncbi:hypothetical protein HK102_004390, partial [Quaeritorhiza haematococci]